MKIAEILLELKSVASPDEIGEVPPDDPKKFEPGNIWHNKHPLKGPHEGRTLNLMLRKMKPAARINRSDLPRFKPYIDKGQIKLVGEIERDPIVTLPGQEWRGQKLMQIWPKLRPAVVSGNSDLEEKLHKQIGLLLGYPKEAIKHFLAQKRN